MAKNNHPFTDPDVQSVFEGFPTGERKGLLQLREAILNIAQETPGVGEVEETLKWGQPAYLTPETKSGSTIRLGLPKQGGFALYAHCQTSIIQEFKDMYPKDFTFEGNRAVHFKSGETPDVTRLEMLIRRALTYHQK